MSDPLGPGPPRPRPLDPLDPLRPRPFPPRVPWTPFGPGDNAQPDPQGIADTAAKLTAELEAARVRLTGMRDGPGPDDTPPVVREVSRADGQWPFLLIRQAPGDVGARPLEDSDIFIIGLGERNSPDIILTAAGPATEPVFVDRDGFPALIGRQVAEIHPGFTYDAWVHVWNLGRTPATGVRVRVFLVPSGQAAGRFLGGRQLDLGDRLSSTSHRIIKAATFPAGLPGDNAISMVVAVAECLSDVATGDRAVGMDRHVAHRQIYTSGI
jgi:hypothetical protein